MSKSLTVSLIIIALMIGIGIGFSLTPEYARMNAERISSMKELGKADRFLDLRYIDNMIAHHLSAIHLAKQVQNTSHREEVRQLANTIIKTDQEGINTLYEYKKQWYNDTRKVTEYQKVNLGPQDAKLDLRFVNALISHHNEAIESAKEVSTKSTRVEILNLASDVEQSLSSSLITLKEWRKAWYGIE